MSRPISPATSLDNLRKEAKRWLKGLRANDPDALARFKTALPAGPENPTLRDVQHALAREHGLDGWVALKKAVGAARAAAAAGADSAASPAPDRLKTVAEYQRVAEDFVAAFDARDESALQRFNAHYNRGFTFDDLFAEVWHRRPAQPQDAGRRRQAER